MNKFALYIGKSVSLMLKLLKKNGGSLPGKVAVKYCPDILKYFIYPKTTILVTGTNGKTSTANLIYLGFKNAGYNVISNNRGDNIINGISSLLIKNSDNNFKIKADVLVLEVDELTLSKQFKNIKASDVVITNFFRDQLDRAGEMESIINKIQDAIKDFKGNLYINENDPNVKRIGVNSKNANIISFGVDKTINASEINNEAKEGKFCPICNSILFYEYFEYSHIGKFYCEKCGFKTQKADFLVKQINYDDNSFILENNRFFFNDKTDLNQWENKGYNKENVNISSKKDINCNLSNNKLNEENYKKTTEPNIYDVNVTGESVLHTKINEDKSEKSLSLNEINADKTIFNRITQDLPEDKKLNNNFNKGINNKNSAKLHYSISATYHIFNLASAAAVLFMNNIDEKYVDEAFANFNLGIGRMENIIINEKKILLNLVKNPTGCNEIIKFIENDKNEKSLIFLLNDNHADGRDTSWIWDVNFEQIRNLKNIILTGNRAYEAATRIKIAIPDVNIIIEKDVDKAVDTLIGFDTKNYVISTYTGLFDIRGKMLKKA